MGIGGVNQDPVSPVNFEDTETIDEGNLDVKINEDHYNDSTAAANNETNLFVGSGENKRIAITPPDTDVQTEGSASFDPSTLTKNDIEDYLNNFPEYAAFLGSQNLVSADDVDSYVLNALMGVPNTNSPAESVVGTALAEQMYAVLSVNDSPEIREMWESLRADILTTNNPMAQVLIESVKQNLINQGVDPDQAAKQATSQVLHELDVELSDNGVVTPFYGTHPEMPAAINRLMVDQLGGGEDSAAFVNQINQLLGMQNGISDAMNAISAVAAGQSTENLLNNYGTQLDNAQTVINTAMQQIQSLPLPDSDKASMLTLMKRISEALSKLKELMADLNISDSVRNRMQSQGKLESLAKQIQDAYKKALETMKKIQETLKKQDKFGFFGKVFSGKMGIATFVLFQVGLAVTLVALLVISGPLFPLVLVAVLPLFTIMAGMSITMFALKESGEMDKMSENFFSFLMTTINTILGTDLSEEDIAGIALGVIGGLPIALGALALVALVALPVVAIVALLLAAPLILSFLPIILAVAYVTSIIAMVAIPILLLLTVMTVLTVAIVILIAIPIMLGIALMLVPELLVRSGIIGKLAEKLGPMIGMDPDELEVLIRIAIAIPAAASGLQVSDRMGEVSEEEQDLIDQQGKTQNEINSSEHKQEKLSAHLNRGASPFTSLAQRAALSAASPEEMEESRKQIEEMMKMLKQIIQKLEKLMQALLSGGSPGDVQDILAEFKTLLQGQLENFPETPESEQGQKYIMNFFDQVNVQIPNIMPPPDSMKDLLRQLQNQDDYEEEEKDLIRTEDLLG